MFFFTKVQNFGFSIHMWYFTIQNIVFMQIFAADPKIAFIPWFGHFSPCESANFIGLWWVTSSKLSRFGKFTNFEPYFRDEKCSNDFLNAIFESAAKNCTINDVFVRKYPDFKKSIFDLVQKKHTFWLWFFNINKNVSTSENKGG